MAEVTTLNKDIIMTPINLGSSWVPKYSGIEIIYIPKRIVIRSEDSSKTEFQNKSLALSKLKELLGEEEFSTIKLY